MKTLIKKIKFVLLIPSLLLAVGCGKSSDSSTSTTSYAYNTSNFSWSGSLCTDLVSGTTVSSVYCNSNPFSYQSGLCYDTYSSRSVSTRYCGVTSSTSTTTTTTTKQCYGYFVYNNGGYPQVVQCYVTNCRGYTLIEYSTGLSVTCQ